MAAGEDDDDSSRPWVGWAEPERGGKVAGARRLQPKGRRGEPARTSGPHGPRWVRFISFFRKLPPFLFSFFFAFFTVSATQK